VSEAGQTTLACPENALTRLLSRRPLERSSSHQGRARQRGFCPSRRLRRADEIASAGDDPVNAADPDGLSTNLGGTAAWAFNNVFSAGNDGYSDKEGDCTDFVSRALLYGGEDAMNFGWDPPIDHTDDDYWYRGKFSISLPLIGTIVSRTIASYSWASAHHLAHHLVLAGGTVLVGAATTPPCPNDQGWTSDPGWKDVQPGDIAFANWYGASFSGIDHAGVITALVDGEPYITQHGPDQQDVPISFWLSSRQSTHVWIIQPK
jgi:hypothetical protein